MEKFLANKKYYTQNPEGYSSTDEFDINTRVHITNELPPLDMFDMVHSSMKNEYWKWFVGDSFLSHDIQYNEFTDGSEIINKNGELEQYSISKYVNGIRCKDYGPIPMNKWIPAHKELIGDEVEFIEGHYEPDYSETYHRYELNGVLLPEFDLLLHEGYRYLNNLYPDHPDWMKLLTLNEFNDEIQQTAYLIDYAEDVNFMDWLSYFLKSKGEDEDAVAMQEAANLKIRNLKHHAFRRKFYGSKTGSRMLGADIFQHTSIYPLAEYIPIEPFERPETFKSVDGKWFNQFEKKPDFYIDRDIDLDNPLLKRQFRLQDNTAKSQDYLKRYKEPAKYFGTAYPTPLSLFDLYEYSLERIDDKNELTYLTMDKDFKPGQKVKFNGQPYWTDFVDGHIVAIYPENAYKTKCTLRHSSDGSVDLKNSKIETSVSENALNHVSVDVPINPIYTELEIYPSNKKLLQKLVEYNTLEKTIEDEKRYDYNELLEDYFIQIGNSEKVFGSTKALHNALYQDKVKATLKLDDPKIGLFSIDPHQDGCLYMAPQQFLTTFEEDLNVQLDTTSWNAEDPYHDEEGNVLEPKSNLSINPTLMSTAGIVKKDDILMYEKDGNNFTSKVLDISGSFMQFTINGAHKNKKTQDKFKKDIANKENSEYCLAFKFSDNNINSANKTCVVYGKPSLADPQGPDRNDLYYFDGVYFTIDAIPKVKSHTILRKIYPTFDEIARKKFISLYTLYGGKQSQNEVFNIAQKNYTDICLHKETFDDCVAALKREIANNIYVVNSKNWVKLIQIGQTLCKDFEVFRPIMMKQLLNFYNNFVEENNVLAAHFDEYKFTKGLENFSEMFTKYFDEYIKWLSGEVAIILDGTYYESTLQKSYPSIELRECVRKIVDADKELFGSMLPNRAFLLDPLPEDLLMREDIDTFSSYSLLTGQDKFSKILHVSINEYDDLIDWEVIEEFGSTGYLKNILAVESRAWDFGVLNTVSTSETNFRNGNLETRDVKDNDNEIDVIENWFTSDDIVMNNFIKSYLIEDNFSEETIPYIDLNEDIMLLSDNMTSERKFSYASSSFLERFLPDEKKNNICGEVETYNNLEILAKTEESSEWILLDNKESMYRMNFISTGDQVIGPTIGNDIFIEEIDYKNNKIRVSEKLTTTGEFKLTFLCKCRFYPEENREDFFKFRIPLSKNLQADSYSVLQHGIDTEEYISNYSPLAPVDLFDFRENLLTSLQEQPNYKAYFNRFVRDLYHDKNPDHFVVPSIYKASNGNFFEVNSYMKYDDDFIMRQEILDYFEQYTDDFNRAAESTNIGVAINGFTRADGITSKDENISSRFITTDDWKTSYPYYIKIGRGCLEDIFGERVVEDVDRANTERVSFYNRDFYNDGYYSGENSDAISQDNLRHYYDIDDPVFTVQLGEYEVLNKYKFDENSGKLITNIQFSVIKRYLNMIKQQKVSIINKDFYSTNSIEKFSASYSKIKINNVDTLINDYTKDRNINYCGEWVPTLNENNELVYPETPINTNVINIYSINKDYIVSNLSYSKRNAPKNIKKGSILIYDGEWKIKQFKFAGLYGDLETLEDLFDRKTNSDGEQKKITSKGSKSIDISIEATFKARLLYKVLSNCGAFRSMDGIDESYKFLMSCYNSIKNGTPIEDLPSTVVINDEFDNSIFADSPNFWFIYIGFKNDDYTNALNSLGLKAGQLLGLVYNNSEFQLVSIKDSIFSYNFEFNDDLVSKIEYETSIGLSCQYKVDPILPTEKADSRNNLIDYKITDIVKNSCQSVIKVDLDLTAKGYEYLDDETVDRTQTYDIKISKDNLFADEKNKLICTYYEGKKYGIVQENNKYFKNIINNIVELKKEKSLGQSGIIVKDSLNPVEGFDFDGNSMTLFDRILSVNKVDLRSIPRNTLESNFYSNYKSFTGTLKGFACDDEEFNPEKLVLEVGYREAQNPQILINKIQQKAFLQKFKPYINENEFSGEDIIFNETEFEGNILGKSDVVNIEVSDLMAETDTTGLKFYKNLLVTEGVINTADPRNIFIENKEVISKISVSDTLVNIVPLNAINNTYVKITLENTSRVVRAIGWKNDVFIVACDDFIGALHITNLSQLDDNRPYKDSDFEIINLGVNNFKVNTLSFDEENQKWVISLLTKDDTFLGTYSFSTSVTGDDVIISDINRVYPDSGTTQVDLDEYALTDIYITENKRTFNNYEHKTISDNYNGGKVLARDLSFSNLPDDSYQYIDPNLNQLKIKQLKQKNADRFIARLYDAGNLKPSVAFDSDGYIVPKDGYLKVSFDLKVLDGGVSMYCSGAGDKFTGIQEYWTYNRNIEKWTYSSSEVFKDFISNYGSSGKVDVYFCGSEFAAHTKFMEENQGAITDGETVIKPLSDTLGEFLWKLPRTNLDSDRVVVVAVMEDNMSPYILAEGLASDEAVKITHTEISAPLQIDQNKILEGNYKIGPYQPEEVKDLPQFTASNFKGYQAVVCGKTIFIKSPLNIWKQNANTNRYEISGQTDEMFWKRARLPSMHESTYELFSNKTLEEAYLLVETQRQLTLNLLKDTSDTFGPGVEALAKWLNSPNGQLLKYTTDEDLPSSIKVQGVQYQYTAQGPRANFDEKRFEKYEADIEIQTYAGITSMVYFKHQIYLNYLRDYYEIILGCNRATDFIKDGIKDLKLTDTHIVIITNNDDILSLKLENSYSKEQIENVNNWSVKSISPVLEVPYLDITNKNSFDPFSYGVNGTFYQTGFRLGNTTQKLYKINSYFINKNIQIYAGYVKYDAKKYKDVIAQMKAIDSTMEDAKAYESLVEKLPKQNGVLSENKYPFICYSTDGGESFYDYGLHSLGISDFPIDNHRNDWSAESIVKVGNSILVFLEGEGAHKTVQFSFESTSGNDLLQQTNKYSDWNGHDFYNAYKPSQFYSGYYCTLLGNAEKNVNKNGFFIEKPYKFSSDSAEIKTVGTNFITYDSQVEPTDSVERLRVLISIDTKNLIEDNLSSINYSSEYLSQTGELLVVDKIEVDSMNRANRVYSVNECLPKGQYSANYIPCLAQDVSKNIYDYNGEDYIPMTNSEGQYVYLCDESGNYLLERNPAFLKQSILKITELMKLSLIYSNSFLTMAKIKENYNFSKLNEVLTDYLNSCKVLFERISYNSDNPKSRFELIEHPEITLADFELYKWPKDGYGQLITDINTLKTSSIEPSMLEFITEIIRRDGDYSQELFDSRFEPKKLAGTNDYYVYDKQKGIILIKEKNFNADISMSYTSKEKSSSFINKVFSITDDIIDQYDGKIINGIYLKEKGYGGLVNSVEWKDELPWENDADAFEDTLLKNEFGSYIYLFNENANKIFMRNGFFFMSPSEVREVSYDNLSKKDNVVKIRKNDYDENPSIQHVYKLDKLEIDAYYSNDICLNDLTVDEQLSVLKFYRGASDVEIFDVEFTSKFYSDEEKTIEVDTPIYFDPITKTLKAKFDGTFYVEYDTIKFKVEGKEFAISCSNTKVPQISAVGYSTFFNDKGNSISIEFTEDVDNIQVLSDNLKIISISTNTVELSVERFETSSFEVEKNGNKFIFNADIRKINPELYLERDWYNEQWPIRSIRAIIYDGDSPCIGMFDFEIFDDKIVATSKQNKDFIITKEIHYDETQTKMIPLFAYVFTESNKEVVLKYSIDEKLLIEGLYGEVLLLKPKYNSFEELVSTKTRIITKEEVDFSNQKLESVSSTKVVLNESSLEEGTLLKVKILPIKSIYLQNDLMNNEDYYTEVSILDIDDFGYDRVWINNEAFLDSPFKLDGIFYNSENMSDYSIEDWKNKDGYSVHLCDSTGHYVKGYVNRDILKYERIGNTVGNCSSEIYQNVDVRMIPKRCNYETTFEKFRDLYLDDKVGNNPFVGTIQLDQKRKVIESSYIWKKVGGKFTKVGYDFISIIKPYSFDISNDKITGFTSKEYFNEKEGKLNFILTSISEKDKYTREFNLCGIKYSNPFYNNDKYWTLKDDFDSQSKHSFIVDSIEDIFNEEVSSVLNITEMGVFNKKNQLIAYMHHPIAQYDTKKNHISYNLFVEN